MRALRQAPGARPGVDVATLAKTMDVLFWNELGFAATMRRAALDEFIGATTHLIYHAFSWVGQRDAAGPKED